jgi:dihydrodipicolinate synthase/N-acetylneuraminate lyase
MTSVTWTGVYPALLTPFTKSDQVDIPLFLKNLGAQADAGVDGIILGGSLGEGGSLSSEEKVDLLKRSKDFLQGAIPVVMNIAEPTTRAAVQQAEAAASAGADGLMLLPPMRYNADDRETLAHFRAVAASTPLPIMIYNNPVDYKILVTLDMFEELSGIQTIQAVKESTRDVSNVTRMFNRFGERFKILCGVDTLAYESFCLGAHGWVAGLVDAFPRETVAIYRLTKAGRHAEALAIYRWFLPVLELDIHPKLVQYIKLAATLTGIGSEWVRAPRLVPEEAEKQRILAIIKEALATRPVLPEYEKDVLLY